MLSGKSLPGKIDRVSKSKREQAKALYIQYENLINLLKSHGSLLNTVKPELLLSCEDFMRMHTTWYSEAAAEAGYSKNMKLSKRQVGGCAYGEMFMCV